MMIGVFAFGNIEAQVTMKDPVSFKLKNGIEVVVAENIGMGKVFASVKIEGEDLNTNAAVSEVLTKLLTEGASAKGKVAFANSLKEIAPKVSVTADEANVAADAEDFENAFLVMSSALQETVIDQPTLDQVIKATKQGVSLAEVKTFYNKQIIPSRTYITIAGNISVAQAKALAKRAFGEWKENSESVIAR
ncbi:Peptidase M16 inactive domain-containing protein [Pedobacter steynii]|uniref:Peptidase M16 inactive domain-containing protein n=1 Tax=Pedobacter steynii TaxID=430522 RepID=A0A1G9SBL3_9SPHI|nr:insulinase family protein [Pedobacter steynii]NQX37477.1 insulinase family protein [Pedobacter steynii]SDM32809.1 Peptidase M16 inactive domain-containing protein [Pedobacter steynii]